MTSTQAVQEDSDGFGSSSGDSSVGGGSFEEDVAAGKKQ